jgi:steroid delta-isomerase-like uncharacterized protein
MRRTIISLTLAILAAACGEEQTPPAAVPTPPPAPAPAPVDTTPPPPAPTAAAAPTPPPKPSMADMFTALVTGYPASFNDATKVGAMYAPDATLTIPGAPDVKGREAIQAFHQQFLDAQTNLKLTPTRGWEKGNMLAVEWVLTGQQAKDWNGMPASDKPWGITGGTVFWLNDDGTIAKEHRYWDLGTYVAQVTGRKGARAIPTPSGSFELHTAKGEATEDKNVGLAKSTDRIFEQADVGGFLGMLADDVTYDDVSSPGPMTGKDGAKKFFVAFTKAFPGMKNTESNVFGVEDFTVNEYQMDATQKAALNLGPGMTIPNTKKTISTHTLEVLQWKDGKVIKGWAYDNGMEFMGQLGLLPKVGDKAPMQAQSKMAAGKGGDAAKKPGASPTGDAAKKPGAAPTGDAAKKPGAAPTKPADKK